MEEKSKLAIANQFVRDKNYGAALDLYTELLESRSDLQRMINSNIELVKKIISKNNSHEILHVQSDLSATQEESLSHKFEASKTSEDSHLRIAVIFHVFHEDVVDEILQHIKKIPKNIQ